MSEILKIGSDKLAMHVSVNSKSREMPEQATVSDLIAALQLGEKRVAVEVNAELVARAEWPKFVLKDGDKIEVVTFVGGG